MFDPQPLIQVENFSLRYGLKTALANVTLDIYRGCITALIGPSGCGKTSFLSSINRLTDLIPGCGITGRIFIDGSDIHDPARDVQALRRQIGMVFQKPTPFPLSIYRNIELPLARTWRKAACRYGSHNRTGITGCRAVGRGA